jgi:Secretion system C-terminal sorting domain
VERTATLTKTFALEQNYPNPFNPSTEIRYQVSGVSDVRLEVFDMLGRKVSTLVNERQATGSYQASFNAAGLASGIYFYKLQAGSFSETKKMMLVK